MLLCYGLADGLHGTDELAAVAGSAVLRIELRLFIITALILELQRTAGAVLHAAAAAQALVLVNRRILPA